MKLIKVLVLGVFLAETASAQDAQQLEGQSSLAEDPIWLTCVQEAYPSKDKMEKCLKIVLSECVQLDDAQTTDCINRRADFLVKLVDDFASEYRQNTTEAGSKILNAELTHSQRIGEANCDFVVQMISRPNGEGSTPESLRAPCDLNEAVKMYGRIVLERKAQE
ncbi:hypothetical protein [Ruegeria atlantica]|uniref:hypothetical protein n=1 Tax=Ruegeria atlantica TaxID=81569 RepID=UPI00147BE38E|nr:hypothetical protein [Ruegeria atlantica]